jgi:hypothetical protein
MTAPVGTLQGVSPACGSWPTAWLDYAIVRDASAGDVGQVVVTIGEGLRVRDSNASGSEQGSRSGELTEFVICPFVVVLSARCGAAW